jgi:predicted enzyme related to lactoylglutathione lyase
MLTLSPFFAGIAVDDTEKAKEFYGKRLGLDISDFDTSNGLLALRAHNGYTVLLYAKPGHKPAEHTVLNFPVEGIEKVVDRLTEAGVEFEHYDSGPLKTNKKGIAQPGPKQAWFRDPAGNILSVVEG